MSVQRNDELDLALLLQGEEIRRTVRPTASDAA